MVDAKPCVAAEGRYANWNSPASNFEIIHLPGRAEATSRGSPHDSRSGDEAIGAIIYHPRPMSSPPPRRLRRGLLVAFAVR